jgi:ubiquinone/menaquinone biosynthesis C-methylase UbiE
LTVREKAILERERLLAEYRRREREIDADRYAPWQPSQLFLRAGRERAAAALLRRTAAFPAAGSPCLEIGYGTGGWLPDLLCWGLAEGDLHGVEIDARRAAAARQRFPSADLRVGDATELPWPSGEFRLVVASTVFTSILDADVRRLVAEESWRVLAPGGALLWYDFRISNPANPNVRGVRRREIRELYPSAEGLFRSVSLAPPLLRLVAPVSTLLSAALEALPLLRTHWIAVLKKPA